MEVATPGKHGKGCQYFPKLSIIVPVHNTEDCLSACLTSILAQTQADIEILCVDDGSTDQSHAMLRRYAADDSRVKILSHAARLGVSAARNTGLHEAAGEYIAFVDSDDCLQPDFCEKLYEAARRADADIAKGNYAYRHHNRIDYGINQKIHEDKANFFIQCCAAIYRAELLRKHGLRFPPKLRASEDLVFAYTAAQHANRIAIADDALIIINTRPGSASFAVPDHKTLISHYRALGIILRMAIASNTAPASFNYVLASLFALFFQIAGRNKDRKIRCFVAAKNLQLFKAVRADPRYSPALFKNTLDEHNTMLHTCLEGKGVERFFDLADTMLSAHCALLRSRIR